VAESEFEQTYGSSVNARMASHIGEGPTEPVDDLEREAVQGEPPVPGAQWDELHKRWEHWDEASQEWVVVGDDPGDGVDPGEENPLPALLERDLRLADEVEAAHPPLSDIGREAPAGPAPRGAQWNEVVGRWERWDEARDEWVEATVDTDPPAT
jgi:hypothetical protein